MQGPLQLRLFLRSRVHPRSSGGLWYGQTRSSVNLSGKGNEAEHLHVLNRQSYQKTWNGKSIEARGFVQSIRKHGKIAFAEIKDGSSMDPIQIVLQPEQAKKYKYPRAIASFIC